MSKDGKTERSWSNLPRDLVENIMSRLFYVDHLRMRAVCTGWWSMYKVPPLKQLPWLMAFNEEESWTSCKLFDPAYKRTYNINIDDGDNGLIQGKKFKDIQIHACRGGWFLMSPSNNPTNHFFLYSPFFNVSVIELPRLNSTFQIATFSTTPTDSDCVFFALYSQSNTTTIRVSTCCRNDKKWITRTFEYAFPIPHTFWKVAFSDGTFYCATRLGNLAMYNIAQHNLCVPQRPKLPENNEREFRFDMYLVESDGDILLIEMHRSDGEAMGAWPRRGIYRLDRMKMAWNDNSQLDGQVLFLGGCDASFPASVAGRKLGEKMANRIHRCWGNKTRHFSFFTNSESYSCVRYYGSLADENCRKMWIEPPYYTGTTL